MPRLRPDRSCARSHQSPRRQAGQLRHRSRGHLHLLRAALAGAIDGPRPGGRAVGRGLAAEHHPRRVRRCAFRPAGAGGGPTDSFRPAGALAPGACTHECASGGDSDRDRTGGVVSDGSAPVGVAPPARVAHPASRDPRPVRGEQLHSHSRPVGPGHGGHLLHLHVSRPVGQGVQRRCELGHDGGLLLVRDAPVHLLHPSALGAAGDAGHHRPAHEEQRTHRDEGLRHQSLPCRAADAHRWPAGGRCAVPARGERARPVKSSGRGHPPCHARRITADLRCAPATLDGRQQRRHLSLRLL